MRDIPFIDAHIHLWDVDRLRYPWLAPPYSASGLAGSVEPIAKSYLPEHYRNDARGWNMIGAVHIDAGADPGDALAETEWLTGLAAKDDFPTAIVAFAPLNDTNIEALLEKQAAHSRVRGIRHIANWHSESYYSYTPANLLDDPSWERGYSALARHGLSFDLQAYPAQLEQAARIAERHDGIPVILNHCGMPIPARDPGRTEWRRGMAAFAQLSNASVKISGFGITDHGWTTESIRPYVLEAIDMFGAERCMFASDFPTDKLYANFDRLLDAYAAIVADFSKAERRNLFAGNANRIYRLALDF